MENRFLGVYGWTKVPGGTPRLAHSVWATLHGIGLWVLQISNKYLMSLFSLLKKGCNFNAFCLKRGQNWRFSAAQPQPNFLYIFPPRQVSSLIHNDNSAKLALLVFYQVEKGHFGMFGQFLVVSGVFFFLLVIFFSILAFWRVRAVLNEHLFSLSVTWSWGLSL